MQNTIRVGRNKVTVVVQELGLESSHCIQPIGQLIAYWSDSGYTIPQTFMELVFMTLSLVSDIIWNQVTDQPVSSAGSFRRGLSTSSSVMSPPSFVIPMTGGSPFLTNSYNPKPSSHQLPPAQTGHGYDVLPGILFAASLNASLATFSCRSPFSSKIILLTATLLAQ